MKNKPEIIANNYCISFIDLLGQKNEYKGEDLLPKLVSKGEIEQFNDKIRKTIKPIYHLQKDASDFMEKALEKDGHLRNQLPLPLKEEFDKMHNFNLIQQRWSDGLVFFVSLQQGKFECPIGGIFQMLGNVGSLCFLGLCKKSPLRGSVDISWGVELHPGEIYGAAVANAYEFESEVAQYPRIVVGERVVTYLEANIKNPKSDVFSEFDRQLSNAGHARNPKNILMERCRALYKMILSP